MKRIKLIALLLPLLFAACSENDKPMAAVDETVTVTVGVALPQAVATRSGTENLTVNRVVCAVFENETELKNLRKEITVTPGEEIVFSPSLIRGHTYTVVFWADRTGCYNTDDLTAITRHTGNDMAESYFDAFTQKASITVTGTMRKTVELRRPFAQLNIGVTQEDWDAVANDKTFNLTPSSMRIVLNGKTLFDAYAGVATGDDSSIEYNLSVSGDDFVADNTNFKRLATCYVLPEAEKQNMDITYSVNAVNGAIRENATIANVPFEANYRTNVFGRLLTGTVSYSISIDNELSGENNKDL